MNLDIIIKILKTVFAKDVDPVEINKPVYLKRRYWGAAIFIGSALAYKHYGLVLGDDVQEVILNNIEVVYNSISALVSAVGVLYGIFVTAKGQMGKTSKLIVTAQVAQHKADMAEAELAGMQAARNVITKRIVDMGDDSASPNITPVTPNITSDSVGEARQSLPESPE